MRQIRRTGGRVSSRFALRCSVRIGIHRPPRQFRLRKGDVQMAAALDVGPSAASEDAVMVRATMAVHAATVGAGPVMVVAVMRMAVRIAVAVMVVSRLAAGVLPTTPKRDAEGLTGPDRDQPLHEEQDPSHDVEQDRRHRWFGPGQALRSTTGLEACSESRAKSTTNGPISASATIGSFEAKPRSNRPSGVGTAGKIAPSALRSPRAPG